MRAVVGGNIGIPLSAQVARSTPDVVHVVEASSFQLETTDSFRPWIAVLLNFSPDHLDRHASVEEYAAAKARIFANQQPDDWAVVNVDDPAAAGAGAARAVARGAAQPVGGDRRRRRRHAPTRSCTGAPGGDDAAGAALGCAAARAAPPRRRGRGGRRRRARRRRRPRR